MTETSESLEEIYDSYRRVYPWYRGPKRIRRLIGWMDADELRVVIAVLILVAAVILTLDFVVGVDPRDILVEAHGLLMDLVVFGILILWFNQRRSTRERIRQHYETLDDLRVWDADEGVLKKVGTINRLIDIAGPKCLPPLDYQQLPYANFQGVDLAGVDFGFANLNNAFLNGTYFAKGYLVGAQLIGACLAWAVCEQADLRGANLQGADLEGVKLKGARLGKITVGQSALNGPTTYVTDLRGVTGLTPELLTSAEGWEDCYRDNDLACGKPIPIDPKSLGQNTATKGRSKQSARRNGNKAS